jgi:REP element-mobilizing transposase RayT
VESKYGIQIQELSFGDDFSHVHMEVSITNKLSIAQVIQILKSHSASKVFAEMPSYAKRYPDLHFWG